MPQYYYKKKLRRFNRKKTFRVFGFLSIFMGLAMLLYFFFPIISYQVFLSAYAQDAVEVPIPKYLIAKKSGIISELFTQGIQAFAADYTDARRWYPSVISNSNKARKVNEYLLSIPKLKITDATVSTTNYDLTKNLVQYYGTSVPPDNGTAVIFGHSTLPQWFDPKNYKTIFATLHTIKLGDEIDATVNGSKYIYKVYSITITSPEDTNIFSQSYDNSYITLVTCTPPGTTWKRLIVRASLQMPGSGI